MLKLLFLSTPVGPLGSGLGGGVELVVFNVVMEMKRRGHYVQVVAPTNSVLPEITIKQIAGNLQIPAQTLSRSVPISLPENSVLAQMWEYARQVQSEYDLIVNFAFDWLPFYLTPFFDCKIAHFVSMGSLTTALDEIIEKVAFNFPHTIGVNSQSQAESFPFASLCQILGGGIDLSSYEFSAKTENALAWLGRISPEKALEDAVAAAQITGIPLKILGKIQDQEYWENILNDYPEAPIQHLGFLSTRDLQKAIRKCRALLMTPRWEEAFGNVAIESLACGVPVIAYNRGGPAEIVKDGKTGFLVEPDSVTGLVEAIGRIDEIDRYACRQQAEREFSLSAMGDRFEAWFYKILSAP